MSEDNASTGSAWVFAMEEREERFEVQGLATTAWVFAVEYKDQCCEVQGSTTLSGVELGLLHSTGNVTLFLQAPKQSFRAC